MTLLVCSGRGDAGGDHCCYIGGKVCYYWDDGCSLRVELGSWDAVHADRRWKRAKVGQWFAENYPGYGCGDWPQNIPEAMTQGSGLCCWQSTS